jgi:glycerate 2-kinase
MRVVIAPDKFKGRLTAAQVADAIERGMRAVLHDAEFVIAPMADGGEGTVDAFLRAGAERKSARVHGPLGDPVDAIFGMLGDTAILEMAAASGLEKVPHERRDVMHADTYGTGELLLAALDMGARRIIIGLGGSATNDAGSCARSA